MDIVKDTFGASLEGIKQHINDCDFFAIDLEMTGIRINDEPENPAQTVEQNYNIKSRVADKFSILQVGVCLFEKKDKNSSEDGAAKVAVDKSKYPQFQNIDPAAEYIARPFNFFVFPGENTATEGREIVLDADTLGFLRKHNMNFQEWIYQGVATCTREGEAQIRKALAEASADAEVTLTEEAVGELVAKLGETDKTWYTESEAAAAKLNETVGAYHAAVAAGKKPSAPLVREVAIKASTNAHARDVLRQTIRAKYPLIKMSSRGRHPNREMVMTRLSETEMQKIAREQTQRRERELVDRIGFRHIYNALAESKKPVIGHNSFADFLFVLSTFEGKLPSKSAEFKELLHERFPLICDTKQIVRSPFIAPDKYPNTALGTLYDHYTNDDVPATAKCNVSLPLGFQAYHPQTLIRQRSQGAAHEAGYDAMMTGVVFLNLIRELGHDRVAAELNQVAMFRSLYSFAMDPSKPHTYLAKDNHALLLEHPATMKSSEIESIVKEAVDTDYATSVKDGRTIAVLAENFALDDKKVVEIAAKIKEKNAALQKVEVFQPPEVFAAKKLTKKEDGAKKKKESKGPSAAAASSTSGGNGAVPPGPMAQMMSMLLSRLSARLLVTRL